MESINDTTEDFCESEEYLEVINSEDPLKKASEKLIESIRINEMINDQIKIERKKILRIVQENYFLSEQLLKYKDLPEEVTSNITNIMKRKLKDPNRVKRKYKRRKKKDDGTTSPTDNTNPSSSTTTKKSKTSQKKRNKESLKVTKSPQSSQMPTKVSDIPEFEVSQVSFGLPDNILEDDDDWEDVN